MTRNELIEENMPLVYFAINKYLPSYRNDEDVIQTGMLALCKVADSYDPSKGAFSTYASKYIVGEIKKSFRDNNKSVKASSLDRMISDNTENDFYDIVMAEEEEFDGELEREMFAKTLSKKQRIVMDGLSRGLTQKEIANEQGVSNQAIGCIVRTIRRKWRRYNGED